MSIRVYDYVCDACGFKDELFCNAEKLDERIECTSCHSLNAMQRMIPAPRAQLDGISGDFPGAAMQWEKRRESHMAKERKHEANHGTEYIGNSVPSE